jgi:rRNA maturation endonuclease Nob1
MQDKMIDKDRKPSEDPTPVRCTSCGKIYEKILGTFCDNCGGKGFEYAGRKEVVTK